MDYVFDEMIFKETFNVQDLDTKSQDVYRLRHNPNKRFKWGRGFEKIKEACGLYDGPLPEYEINESGIMVLCKACDRYLELLRDDGQDHDQNGHDMVMMILDFCKEAKSVPEIMEKFGFESRTSFRRKYLNDLVENGKLKMTMPDKPKSKNQKYYS